MMSIFSLQTILISQVPMSQMCGGAPDVIVQHPPNCTLFTRHRVMPVPTVSSPIIHCLTASSMMSAVCFGWSAISISMWDECNGTSPPKSITFTRSSNTMPTISSHISVLPLHYPWCPHNAGNGVQSPCHPWWAAAGSAFQCGAYRMSMFRTVIVRAWLLASIVVMDDTSSIG